jgi:hypothetical protein
VISTSKWIYIGEWSQLDIAFKVLKI